MSSKINDNKNLNEYHVDLDISNLCSQLARPNLVNEENPISSYEHCMANAKPGMIHMKIAMTKVAYCV